MKLGIFVSHPIQYFVPMWRRLAAGADLQTHVHFFSDQSVRGGYDPGFGRNVAWDVPLLDGYPHTFISRDADLSRPASVALADAAGSIGGFDAVMVHGYIYRFERQLVTAARKLGIRTLMRGDFRDLPPEGGRSVVKSLLRDWHLRRYYRQVGAFCWVGAEAKRHLRRLGVGEDRLFFSPHSVDTDLMEAQRARFPRASSRAELGVPEGDTVIVFSGKLIPVKAPLMMIESLRSIADSVPLQRTWMLFVGDGELRQQIEAAARPLLGPRLIMAGFVNQSTIGKYYAAGDLFVLPSHSESWGLVVNEAMQFGLPVVASDGLGCRSDLIIDASNGGTPGTETGLSFPAGDGRALAGCLRTMLLDPDRRRRMAENARTHMEAYTTARSVDGIREALGLPPTANRCAS